MDSFNAVAFYLDIAGKTRSSSRHNNPSLIISQTCWQKKDCKRRNWMWAEGCGVIRMYIFTNTRYQPQTQDSLFTERSSVNKYGVTRI